MKNDEISHFNASSCTYICMDFTERIGPCHLNATQYVCNCANVLFYKAALYVLWFTHYAIVTYIVT
jgi:hypothetical protein